MEWARSLRLNSSSFDAGQQVSVGAGGSSVEVANATLPPRQNTVNPLPVQHKPAEGEGIDAGV